MPQRYGVDNCGLPLCREGKQLDIRESWYQNQFSWYDWQPVLGLFRVYLFPFSLHQHNVNQSGSHMQTSQTLRFTSSVLLSTSRCSQAPLEQSKMLSDSARAFSGDPESTCSYGGAFRMLRDLTYRIVKFRSIWDLCTGLQETSRAAETAVKLCWRLCAILSQQWFLGFITQGISSIIFVFVTVTRFATS